MSEQYSSETRTIIIRLVEMLLVFGVLGVLLYVSSKKFETYRSRARQVEVKVALVSLFHLEKTFHSEYGSYVSALDALGFIPEGHAHYYSVGWRQEDRFSPKIPSYHGEAKQFHSSAKGTPFAHECLMEDCMLCIRASDAPFNVTNTQKLIVSGSGRLTQKNPCDIWTINEQKAFVNLQSGIE